MSRRFIPPPVDALGDEAGSGSAMELARAREAGLGEGLLIGRDEGYAAGLLVGHEQAEAAHRAELAKLRAEYARQYAVETVLSAVQRLLAAQEETRRGLEIAARAAIAGALRTIFPVLLDRAAGAEIAALISEAAAQRGSEQLTLRCGPDTLAAVREQGLTETNTLILLPDETMDRGVAAATWSSGGLLFDPTALLERVVAVLSPDPPPQEVVPA